MKLKLACIDVETEANPEAESIFQPTFKPNGTLKDPEKIKADLAQKRLDWIGDGALYAERGRILAIGYNIDGCFYCYDDDEKSLLEGFISTIRHNVFEGYTICGFNILDFDLPYIRKRCLILGIPFPFYDRSNRWNPWTFPVFDAMKDWTCGKYNEYVSLDTVARALGVGQKTGNGKDFAKLFREDKEKAIEYLSNDLELSYKFCERMLS